MEADFIHLKVHSSYSLAEGAIKIDELVSLCQKQRMPAVAVTDSGNLFCSLEFSKECSNRGIQPIIGCILPINSQLEDNYNQLDKIVLYAKNQQGYLNLLKLASEVFVHQPTKNYITLDILKELNEGLIVLTGGIFGTFGRLLLNSQLKKAENFLIDLYNIFSDRLYIEITRHGLTQEEAIEESLIELAYRNNIPLVATNEVYFATQDMYQAHDALLCIAEGKYMIQDERRRVNNQHYFKSSRQMKRLFADLPEAINNTVVIAKRCAVKSEERAPILPKFTNYLENVSSDEKVVFIDLAKSGLNKRLTNEVFNEDLTDNEQLTLLYHERLNYELNIITKMNFAGYFLIVADFITWSKRNNIPVGPGRGSGAGSLVAWSLEITDLNPIRFGLLFERFLNPERVSMPDFDIDFCQDSRDKVINYVKEKYGKDQVAQIITFGKLQARAVIRDVGRVLQLPYLQVDKISKLVPFNAINPVTLSQALEMEPALRRAKEEDEEISKLISIALKLEGLNRHASTHAAGIVIAGDKLQDLVPLYKDPKSDMLVVQYSMKYAEAAGLVKFDFLGLKTLTLINNACQLIRDKGELIEINKIPLNDQKTFKLLTMGLSTGVFQFESPGMKDALRKMRPDAIEDLIALGALYRPGPMDNIPVYIACKHGVEKPNYLHPKLESILRETFGVIIYQEQVMQIAQILANYTLGAADLLRRAMGKKIKAEMDAQRQIFVEGAIANNVDKEQASSIFDLVAKFAGYGFNKSHAAAYAIISYQTAYLKANFPVEFLVASLNLEIDDTDKINIYIQEAKLLKINVLAASINESFACFSIDLDEQQQKSIRYGLGAIKGISNQAMQLIANERAKNKFIDIFDFAKRIDSKIINKRQLENLIKAGAFDCLNSNRQSLYLSIDLINRYSINYNREKLTSQFNLFKNSIQNYLPVLIQTEDWSISERLQLEGEAIGFYLADHPLDDYQLYLEKFEVINSATLRDKLANGFFNIKIAGVINSKKTRVSARGRFVSISFSDPYGIFEASIYDDHILATVRHLLDSKDNLLINAELRKDEGGTRLNIQSISYLDDFLANKYKLLTIWLADSLAIESIKTIVNNDNNNKNIQLKIIMELPQHQVAMAIPTNFKVNFKESLIINNLISVKKISLD